MSAVDDGDGWQQVKTFSHLYSLLSRCLITQVTSERGKTAIKAIIVTRDHAEQAFMPKVRQICIFAAEC